MAVIKRIKSSRTGTGTPGGGVTPGDSLFFLGPDFGQDAGSTGQTFKPQSTIEFGDEVFSKADIDTFIGLLGDIQISGDEFENIINSAIAVVLLDGSAEILLSAKTVLADVDLSFEDIFGGAIAVNLNELFASSTLNTESTIILEKLMATAELVINTDVGVVDIDVPFNDLKFINSTLNGENEITQFFNTTGNNVFIIPDNVNSLDFIELRGAGGNGGNASLTNGGGGGGGGAFARKNNHGVTPAQEFDVFVGASAQDSTFSPSGQSSIFLAESGNSGGNGGGVSRGAAGSGGAASGDFDLSFNGGNGTGGGTGTNGGGGGGGAGDAANGGDASGFGGGSGGSGGAEGGGDGGHGGTALTTSGTGDIIGGGGGGAGTGAGGNGSSGARGAAVIRWREQL